MRVRVRVWWQQVDEALMAAVATGAPTADVLNARLLRSLQRRAAAPADQRLQVLAIMRTFFIASFFALFCATTTL